MSLSRTSKYVLRKATKEFDHLRIRVGKAQLVTSLRSLGPVEHATRQMERFGSLSKRSTALLRGHALGAVLSSVLTPSTELPVIGGGFCSSSLPSFERSAGSS